MIYLAIAYTVFCVIVWCWVVYEAHKTPRRRELHDHTCHDARWVSAEEITRDVVERDTVYIDTRKHRLN